MRQPQTDRGAHSSQAQGCPWVIGSIHCDTGERIDRSGCPAQALEARSDAALSFDCRVSGRISTFVTWQGNEAGANCLYVISIACNELHEAVLVNLTSNVQRQGRAQRAWCGGLGLLRQPVVAPKAMPPLWGR
eukprot:6285368-Prymnesium_polylepis.2